MKRRASRILLATSIVAAVLAVVVWARADEPRADLAGAEVRTATSKAAATPTTSTSTSVAPTTPATTTVPAPAPPAEPRSLTIGNLGVEAPVVPVGLEDDGSMEVPSVAESGWYLHGPRPGNAQGNAVIVAHVDYGGRPGVFFDLRRLEVGAEVVVTDARGDRHGFRVTERFQVDKDELPIEELFVADGPPGLALITCGGAFDRGARSYEDNIVVRAVPV